MNYYLMISKRAVHCIKTNASDVFVNHILNPILAKKSVELYDITGMMQGDLINQKDLLLMLHGEKIIKMLEKSIRLGWVEKRPPGDYLTWQASGVVTFN